MITSRRFFLSGASALAATLVAGGARAQNVIDDILKSSGRGWDDTFDARSSNSGAKVASTLPIFSPQTVSYTEQAIAQYQDLVARGGWDQVPATRSEEHTSELQSLSSISYAVFCLRSEERRVGKECSLPCRSRWSPYH